MGGSSSSSFQKLLSLHEGLSRKSAGTSTPFHFFTGVVKTQEVKRKIKIKSNINFM
jgi:hypothetical protein